MIKKTIALLAVVTACIQLNAQNKPAAFPGLPYIRPAELKRDIFELAGDAFRGRRAGTLDEMRAAAWVAQRAQEAGLKPAGEDGTYFQYFNRPEYLILYKKSEYFVKLALF